MPQYKDYIPGTDAGFHSWQQVLVKQCDDKQAAWNIPAAEITALKNRQAEYEPVYAKKIDYAVRSTVDVQNHRQLRKKYVGEIRRFVQAFVMKNPSMSHSDKVGLSLNAGKPRRRSRSKIDDVPHVLLRSGNNGMMFFNIRRHTDENRSSMHAEADAIEMRYLIGTTAPVGYNNCPNTFLSTTAKFSINLGSEAIGKWLFVYVKWRNLVDDSRSGMFTDVHKVMIA